MKNMFKKSLVALALASIGATATAATTNVDGGQVNAHNSLLNNAIAISEEWLNVATSQWVNVTEADDYTINFTLQQQYSIDDRIFIEFDAEDAVREATIPNSRVGSVDGTGVMTLGLRNVTSSNGKTIIEYRVTDVDQGADTEGAVFSFGVANDGTTAQNFSLSVDAIRSNGGLNVSLSSVFKDGGELEASTTAAVVAVGSQLDSRYAGNITARINTFDDTAGNQQVAPGSRTTWLANSGQGRALTTDGGNSVFTTAAEVTDTTIDNNFDFTFSTLPNALDWDYALTKYDFDTTVEISGDFSWAFQPVAGVSTYIDGAVAANCVGYNEEGALDSSANADATVVATPSSVVITCDSTTDFELTLDNTEGRVLRPSQFAMGLELDYGYEDTKELTLNAGAWTNDGYSVFVPYMPYGRSAGISQLIFITNTGPAARQLAVDVYPQNHNGVSFEEVQPLQLDVMVQPGINRVTGDIQDALIANGFLGNSGNSSRSFAFDFIISGAEDEIEVYTGYNVNNDRNYVPNTSNREDGVVSDFRRTGTAINQ